MHTPFLLPKESAMSAPTKPSKPLRLDPNDIPKDAKTGPGDTAPGDDELAEAALKRAKAAKKAKKREREAEEARLAERIRLAEEKLAREESKRGFGTKAQWLVGSVLAVLVFQVVHSAEHVAQATYWLFNPTVAPWMSAWAMGMSSGLGNLVGGSTALGMELLHLIGNGIFLGGLLLAFRLPEQYKNPQMLRWLRIATIVEALHFVEHVFLTASVALAGKAVGLSTMFGLMPAGTPAASGYRVAFHLVVNLAALVFAVKAFLAVRDKKLAAAGRTPSGFDWRRMAILCAPVVGLIFLLPIFQGHVVHTAAADTTVVATVNGQDITNGELTAAVELATSMSGVPQLGVAAPAGEEGVMSEEEITFTTLNRLVQNELVIQAAAGLGVTVAPGEVEARKAQLIQDDFGGREGFEEYLAERNATEEYADTQVEFLLLQERVFAQLTADEVIATEDVQAVFTAEYEGFPQGRQLLTQTEELANQFLAQVQGGGSFEQLIMNESTDPRAATDSGFTGVVRDGAQVPEIVQAIEGMQDGGFTVVRTQFGWHVLQRLAPPTLPAVEAEIREKLLLNRQATVGQDWLAEIRAAALVSLSSGYGVWNTEYGAVVSPDFTG